MSLRPFFSRRSHLKWFLFFFGCLGGIGSSLGDELFSRRYKWGGGGLEWVTELIKPLDEPEDRDPFKHPGWLHSMYRIDLQWMVLQKPPGGEEPTDEVLLEMARKGDVRVVASAGISGVNGVQVFTSVQLETQGPDEVEDEVTVSLFTIPVRKSGGLVEVSFLFPPKWIHTAIRFES